VFGICVANSMWLVAVGALYAVWWKELGRPWEAFVLPQLGMVTMALVIPRYGWLAEGLVLAYLLDALGIFTYYRLAGVSADALPHLEPVASLTFAVVGVGLVRMREQRRVATIQYLRAQAENATLHRMGAPLRGITDAYGASLRDLREGLGRLMSTHERPATVKRLSGAIDNLSVLHDRLVQLGPKPDDASEVGEAAPATPPDSTRAEREFLARDAQDSVTTLAAIVCIAVAMIFLVMRHAVPGWPVRLLAVYLFATTVILLVLLRTSSRPSPRRTMAAFLGILLPVYPLIVVTTAALSHLSAAFELFLGPKLAMALLPIAAPRYLTLGALLEAAFGVGSIVLYYAFGFSGSGHRFAMSEPWLTLAYAFIGLALLYVRDQRRLAQLRLLRADAELTASARRAGISIAILDQAGSPLQVILLAVDMLRARGTDPQTLSAIEEASKRLCDASRSVAVNPESLYLARRSFDAAWTLTRQRA
jgi:hypothetical protein